MKSNCLIALLFLTASPSFSVDQENITIGSENRYSQVKQQEGLLHVNDVAVARIEGPKLSVDIYRDQDIAFQIDLTNKLSSVDLVQQTLGNKIVKFPLTFQTNVYGF